MAPTRSNELIRYNKRAKSTIKLLHGTLSSLDEPESVNAL